MFTAGSSRSAQPVARAVLAAVLAAAVSGGCARAIEGTPTANTAEAQAVRAEQQEKRDCDAARTAITDSLVAALRQAETDFVAGAEALQRVLASNAPREMTAKCGTRLMSVAYSQMLVDLQAVELTVPSAKILRSGLMRGLCATDGRVELTAEAERACTVR
ncbi:hypothetical protein SAMN05443637_109101 [Pseudonocardia thermophila]|jgi:hypothetical protein|uniref:Uncharacterized protein n=1 Tax=Pseudonocardia thermophila TaxID=1848 RepID=A0A1M6U324_PSETH|nr:hypothetical protein [Pseudonocardia thermophila]SHK63586.1 hypothetical protein SAMN05443637_109101 [Pseudonocardia thermophila]